MHLLKLPITLKCRMKTMLSHKKTCSNTPLNMNYFDKYLQLFPSKFYAWRTFSLLFLGEILSLCDKKKVVNPKGYIFSGYCEDKNLKYEYIYCLNTWQVST